MSSPDQHAAQDFAARRATALANVRLFRAMARRARRDGLPRAELRAANARAAAWIVIRAARKEARLYRPFREVLARDAELT